MNTEQMNKIVTPEEYFTILAKKEITPKERSQKNIFEDFISNCEKNPDLLSPAVEDIYSAYKRGMAKLFAKENKTPMEIEVVASYQRKIAETKNQESNEENLVRTLNKAGYVNATIILVMILNIGFIIAMALLGSK